MPPFRGRRAPPPRNSVASAMVEKKSEEEVGQLRALRRYGLVPPPFFAARGFVSAPLTLSSATFATSVLAIAVVFLAALDASVTLRRRLAKKSETASSVTPADLHFQNISQEFPFDRLTLHKQNNNNRARPGGRRNEEPTLATSGRSRRPTAASRDAAIARALTPPLDGGGRRGPRGRTSLALFLLLEDKAPKVASCGLPTRVWGQLTGLF